ncbi:UDP-glucose 4-epimerase GalE [Mycolicibacterium sp. S3B2]|uniref:UDP-glucose 4-epimerase GalE n=1 Tax=Mycolicibacterium sp. S3B2 TaxID=3415120 RepID=UPI003C7B205A
MTRAQTVLITGGGGYIGSHACVAFADAGFDIVVVDDHSTTSRHSIDKIAQLVKGKLRSYSIDINHTGELTRILREHSPFAVIHFAARKAVGESTQIPTQYFDTNIGGTTSLLRSMRDAEVYRLIFSSSCSIYGGGNGGLLKETSPARPTNPYAWSKLTCEQLIAQTLNYHSEFRAISLRYFNPIGAHPSAVIGEDPSGVPLNLMPYMNHVAIGRRKALTVFGNDYLTPDGTAIRDYIHVMDVVGGHVVALEHINDSSEMEIFNLGTGVGTSVLELRSAFELASGRPVPYEVKPRRPGDVAELVADASKAQQRWGWEPRFNLADMCRDAWNFQLANPGGYEQSF